MSQKRKSEAVEEEKISKYSNNDSLHTKESWLDEKTADVYFIIETEGNDKPTRIPAHKSKLASKSEVFDAMFFGDMAEKGDVHIVDVSVDIFKMFLRFFYDCNVVKLTVENIIDVTNICNKYNVIHGLEECDKFLRSIMSYDNIIDVYEVALTFERRKLKRFCEAKIKANPHAVFHSNSFLECKKLVLGHILDLNFLLCSDVDIFEACISWTKAASGLEELTKQAFAEHFGDLLYKIRFAAISPKDFACLSRKYGRLISKDDYKEIAETIMSGGEFAAINFRKEPRQAYWNKEAIIECNRTVRAENNVRDLELFDIRQLRTTFSSNEPLLLGEFTIEVNFLFDDAQFRTLIFVVLVKETKEPHVGVGRTLKRVYKRYDSINNNVFEILLPQPVLIRPGIFYTILLKNVSKVRKVQCWELKKKVNLDDGITIQFHDRRPHAKRFHIAKNEIYGFISNLKFNRL